jgi:septal ring factor EnvC (AmiA/AmiB activator)
MLVAMRKSAIHASRQKIACAIGLPVLAFALATQAAEQSNLERRAGREERLSGMRSEISRLESEVRELQSREKGLLGEIERVRLELNLRDTEHRKILLELESVTEQLDETAVNLERLDLRQQERRGYLASRLRGLYSSGPDAALKQFLGGEGAVDLLAGARYAAYLSSRDAGVIEEYRSDAVRLIDEKQRLNDSRAELDRLSQEQVEAEKRLEASRRSHERMLVSIKDDRGRRQTALDELRGAAEEMARLVDSFGVNDAEPLLDMRKFRGLLDWPARGVVSAGFGSVIHPRFKTRVPHPGLDIEGDFDDDILNVFDGEVVFASWMRGYGLTLIVDHGGGLLSIYAHASVLMVDSGEDVLRGQRLGKIGDSGSLRGSYLYFELRTDGKPVDPVEWFRRRP